VFSYTIYFYLTLFTKRTFFRCLITARALSNDVVASRKLFANIILSRTIARSSGKILVFIKDDRIFFNVKAS